MRYPVRALPPLTLRRMPAASQAQHPFEGPGLPPGRQVANARSPIGEEPSGVVPGGPMDGEMGAIQVPIATETAAGPTTQTRHGPGGAGPSAHHECNLRAFGMEL